MVRLGAIADIHARAGSEEALEALFAQCATAVDVLVIAGDLTETGTEEEARVLARVLDGFEAPVVAVLGNHDFHHNQSVEIQRVLRQHGVVVLDGDGWVVERDGLRVGLAGCVGFGGGFRPYNLTAFGEPAWKALYEKTLEETRKLDRALSAVKDADYVVAVTHYSPCVDTMGEEPEPLHPYLGSSELGDALERHRVTFCVHGHAHMGRRDGCTAGGVPVFNVALPVITAPAIWTFEPGGTSRLEPVLARSTGDGHARAPR